MFSKTSERALALEQAKPGHHAHHIAAEADAPGVARTVGQLFEVVDRAVPLDPFEKLSVVFYGRDAERHIGVEQVTRVDRGPVGVVVRLLALHDRELERIGRGNRFAAVDLRQKQRVLLVGADADAERGGDAKRFRLLIGLQWGRGNAGNVIRHDPAHPSREK